MFSVLLVVGLFTGVLCVPLPNPTAELSNELTEVVEPSSFTTNIPQEINPPAESDSVNEEKLEAQETFYPVGGVWWGVRPWGGWGGWGGYRPWHRPHWGGQWGGHWGGGGGGHWGGGHWVGGPWSGGHWGRTSS